jgi:hypothetical protein
MGNGTRIFDHGTEFITNEWIVENCDSIKGEGTYRWCQFEVESTDDGYLFLCVQTRQDDREAFAFEIEAGVATSGGWFSNRVGIGLYEYLKDLRVLLEVLARGNHF